MAILLKKYNFILTVVYTQLRRGVCGLLDLKLLGMRKALLPFFLKLEREQKQV